MGLSTDVSTELSSDDWWKFFGFLPHGNIRNPFFFFLSRAILVAYWSPQAARGLNWNCSYRTTLQPQQLGIWVASATYTTAHGTTGSLTHWARPEIEPVSSWILVKFVTCWATIGTPGNLLSLDFSFYAWVICYGSFAICDLA